VGGVFGGLRGLRVLVDGVRGEFLSGAFEESGFGSEGPEQRVNAGARGSGDEVEALLCCSQVGLEGGEPLGEFFGFEEVGLVHCHQLGSCGEFRVVGGQFVVDGDVVGDEVFSGRIEEVEEEGSALDVFEEADAEAFAFVGALDEAGHVSDDEGEVGEALHDAEVWHQGGEGEVPDGGSARGYGADEGAFAHAGEADDSDVGDEFELHADSDEDCGFSGLSVSWGPFGGGSKEGVSFATSAAGSDSDSAAWLGQVCQQFSGFVNEDEGSRGDGEYAIFARASAHLLMAAFGARFGFKDSEVAVVYEGIFMGVSDDPDVAAFAAIAAVGAATGNTPGPAEGGCTGAALSTLKVNDGLVHKHEPPLHGCTSLTTPRQP